jgi:hypothetical protein
LKGKYENRKILDFAIEKEKKWFFLNFFCCFFYFLIIWSFYIILEFLKF